METAKNKQAVEIYHLCKDCGAKVWLEGHAYARGRWNLEDIEVLTETVSGAS